MTGSHHRTHSGLAAPLRHPGRTLVALAALFAVVGSSSVALAFTGTGGGGSGKFAATFDARAVGDPTAESCPALGRGGLKTEARYQGTMTIDGEEFAFNFTTLEILVDRSTGVGTAEGNWQLAEPPDPDIVASGELIAVVKMADLEPPDPDLEPPDPDLEPPDPDLELHGLLIGLAEPPEPDMPAQRLLANFTASLSEGALNFTTVGDPGTRLLPAVQGVLLPAVKC